MRGTLRFTPLVPRSVCRESDWRFSTRILRTDPFEWADITSNTYYDWLLYNGYLAMAGSTIVTEFLKTFKDFPPRQKAASFTIDQALVKMESAASGALH